jgi:hypothetical protein
MATNGIQTNNNLMLMSMFWLANGKGWLKKDLKAASLFLYVDHVGAF